MEKVKEWYNGYYFGGTKVYNPFDILLFITNDFMFKNYWFGTATPNFLIEVLKKKDYFIPKLENLVVEDEIIESFDIENIALETLLFQAGYLTIDQMIIDEEFDLIEYKLRVPNKEVQISLNKLFLRYFISENNINVRSGLKGLMYGELEGFKSVLISLFASIPYNNYTNNKMYNYEGYYASVIYT